MSEKKYEIKRYVMFLIVFIIVFIFSNSLYKNNLFISYQYKMPNSTYHYNINDIIEFNGIERNDKDFFVNKKDSYFKIISNKEIKSINFNIYSSRKNKMKLYYSVDSESFSEINTFTTEWNNSENLTFNIDDDNVHYLMVKIDYDFTLQQITLSNKNAKLVEKDRIKRNDTYFFIIDFIVSICIAYLIVFKCYQIVINKIKSITSKKIIKLLKNILFYLLTLIAIILLQSFFTRGLVIKNTNGWVINTIRVAFSIGLNTLIWGIIWLKDSFKNNKIENIFLIVSLSIGIPFAIALPMLQEGTWDAGIHYGHTVELLYSNSDSYPEIENGVGWLNYSYNIGELETISSKYDIKYKTSKLVPTSKKDFIAYYKQISYLPLATGIFVSRGLGFSFTQSIVFGKIFNIIFYSIIIYLSIRKLKKGKLILFIISLYPTALLLAGTYSYDPWVISLMCLGLSYLIANYQEKYSYLTLKDALIIGFSLFLSLGPKAIYFPIMLLCLFLPKSKFKDIKYKYIFNAFIITLMFLSLISFLLPFVIGVSNGTEVGDLRGGENVNSTEQVKFILSHPVQYTKTLLSFLKEYWSFSNIPNYTTLLGYVPSTGKLSSLLIANMLFVLVIGYKENNEKRDFIFKIFGLFLIFGISCLVATALYVSYTPVGLNAIGGCQPRYLLPLLFPTAYFLCNVYKPILKINRTALNYIVCSISSFVLVYNVLVQIVLLYWVS